MDADLPMDVVTEILTRFPPNSRRRFRLVCKLWHDAVDATTNMENRVKTLVFVRNSFGSYTSSAYIIDDPSSKEGWPRELWESPPTASTLGIVGTCNGLICLTGLSNGITLVNPTIGERISIPSPVPDYPWYVTSRPKAYALAYHETKEQYKIVHVPPYAMVRVFTLGETTWRSMQTPFAPCDLGTGIVAIDGVAYWPSEGSKKIVSFDIRTEQLTTFQRLPVQGEPGYNFQLVEVCGRLGIVAERTPESTTKIWVLESTGWRQWQEVLVHEVDRKLTTPHVAHGNYLLTKEEDRNSVLYGHRLSNGLLRISKDKPGKVVSNNPIWGSISGTFAYVETKEPLSIYSLNNT